MATAKKRAMARAVKAIVRATKRARVREARGMGTMTRVACNKEGNDKSNK
jgi:hypothetical protein